MELTYSNKDNLLQVLNEKTNEDIYISFEKDLSVNDLHNQVKEVLDIEETLENKNNNNIFLKLKSFSYEHKKDIIEMAMKDENLLDIVLLLNVINLIKCYNDLEDSYFEDEKVLVSSIDELLDLTMDLDDVIRELKKKVSIAFMSIFKSYHKFEFADTDEHRALPNILRNIFLSCDLLTISSIFGTSDNFNTDELYYVDNAMFYIQESMYKNSIFKDLSNEILKDLNNDN